MGVLALVAPGALSRFKPLEADTFHTAATRRGASTRLRFLTVGLVAAVFMLLLPGLVLGALIFHIIVERDVGEWAGITLGAYAP